MSRKEEDFEELEATLAHREVALEKRMNEIRRLEGVKDKLLAALIGIAHGLEDKSGDFLAVADILAAQARTAIEEAK